MEDKSLSTDAHNVKVISQNGTVTLKGPVKSEAEKSAIVSKAVSVAGAPTRSSIRCPSSSNRILQIKGRLTWQATIPPFLAFIRIPWPPSGPVDQILAAGFSNNDISVLLPDNESSKAIRA
jgi:hypothetical protein